MSSSTTHSQPYTDGIPPSDGRSSPWPRFAILAAAQFLMVLDTTVVYVALPSIGRSLSFEPASLGWVMDAYMLGLGGFLLIGGRLADVVGRRRLFVAGIIGFGLASLLCGLAFSPAVLILGRALQGFSAAMVTPAAMALITDIFDEGPDRYKAYGIFGGIGGVAGAAGGVLGGLLTSVGWELVFFVNLPAVVALVAIARRRLPEAHHRATGRPDFLGAGLVTSGSCLVLYTAVHAGATRSFGPTLWITGVLGVFAVAGFIVRQRTAESPLVPRPLYRSPGVLAGNLVNACVGFVMFGGFFVVTLYLQVGRHLDVVPAAMLILPISIAIFVGSQVGIKLLPHAAPTRGLAIGLMIQAVALGGLWLLLPDADGPLLRYVVTGVVWGVGLGISIVTAFVVCTTRIEGPMQGAASGLVNASLQIGGAVGVAVMSVLVAHGASNGTDKFSTGFAVAGVVALVGAILATAIRTNDAATHAAEVHQ